MDTIAGEIPSAALASTLDSGARVHIQQGGRPLRLELVGRVGTVVEVFRMPQGSCMVRIDGDSDNRREWFFYRDEMMLSNA